jgi:hypothetical protein
MGWSGYTVTISLSVDAHGGEKEQRGEELRLEFMAALAKFCDDPKYAEISPMY